MKRSLKYGSMSLTVTILFLVGVVLFNILVGLLADRFYLKFDLTSGGLFDIGGDTRAILSDMDDQVTFTVLAEESDYANTGSLAVVREFLQKYAALSNGKIQIRYLNPDLNPSLATEYEQVTLASRNIIVESSRRYTLVSHYDLFATEQSSTDYSTYITGLQAEQTLTNAVLYVLNEVVSKAVFITGHNEASTSELEAFMKKNNFLTEALDLSLADMPADATVAVVMYPQGDYTEAEINKLDAFLSGGGNVIWFGRGDGINRDRLDRYFSEWGLSFGKSFVLEPEKSDPSALYNIYPEINLTEGLTDLIPADNNKRFLSSLSSPIVLTFETKGSRAVTPLLTTSNQSYARAIDDEGSSVSRQDTDAPGPFNIAAISTETRYDTSGRASRSSVMAINYGATAVYISQQYGSASLLDDSFSSTFINTRFLSSLFNFLNPKAQTVYIAARSTDVPFMTIESGQAMVLFWILVVIIPLFIFGLGIVVWRRRRHL